MEPESPETRLSGKASGSEFKEKLCGSPPSVTTIASSPGLSRSPQSASSPGLSTPSPVKRADPVKRKRGTPTPLADGPPFWSCFSTPESSKPVRPATSKRRVAPTPLADGPPFWSAFSTPESVKRPGLRADGDSDSPRTPRFQKVSKPVQHDSTKSASPMCDEDAKDCS